MNKKTLMIVGGIVAVLVVGSLVSRMVGKSAAERAIESATGGKAKVNADGSMTVQTDQGTFSSSTTLPDNFPSDVPVYPKSKVQASIASSDQDNNGNYVSLETSDNLADVIAWYKKEVVAKGWKIVSDAMIGGNLILSAEKDSRALSVTVSEDSGKVVVGLVTANK